MVRSLVAGGAGFLGSHLCERLLGEGHEVLCVDNLLTGSRHNITHLATASGFTFLEHDITQPLLLDESLDYVLHLASPASPRDYLAYPIETLLAGSAGTLNLLELARKKGAVFLLASTSEVYGDAEIHPQPETSWGHVNPIGPRSVYDEAKRYAEALSMAYQRKFDLHVRIARIFNAYGSRMKAEDGRVVSNFITQALRDEPLTIYDNGSQPRSPCYVSDLVGGMCKLLARDVDVPVNLGNPDEVTILELAKQIRTLARSRSEITFLPLPTDDPRNRRPSIERAQELLDWTPRVSREEGLRLTVDYFRSLLGGYPNAAQSPRGSFGKAQSRGSLGALGPQPRSWGSAFALGLPWMYD
jgi:dTDP-glucose 4,6-dehydratase